MVGDQILITGPGRCGKTHRLEELADAHDGPVRWIRGTPLEQATPFGALRALVGPAEHHHDAAGRVLESVDADTLLLVDDAHLLDGESVATIAALVGRAPGLVVAHRPSARPDLAALDDVVTASGRVERLGPLDEAALGAVLASSTGRAVDRDQLIAVLELTGGVPGWAVPLADLDPADDAAVAEALSEPVAAELARAGPTAVDVARARALASELPDDVVAVAVGTEPSEVGLALDALASGGLLDPGTGALRPGVVAAIRALLTGAQRRDLHRRLAAAVLDRGGEVRDAAEHLLRAGATGAEPAAVLARAADEVRFREPETALEWYAEAAAAGAVPVSSTVGSIEAEAWAGRPTVSRAAPPDLTDDDRVRLLAVRAVDEAREGRTARAAELLGAIAAGDGVHPALSADAARLLGVSLTSAAPTSADQDPAPHGHDPLDPVAEMASRLATACGRHGTDPRGSATRFADAATALEQLEPTVVLPDSPHAIGSLHLAAIGDLAGASVLVERATRAEAGGPVLATRHRVLEAWLQLRSGRYELPVAVVRRPPEHPDGRDQLVVASIGAGLARRNGDIARLRDAWSAAEPLLLAGVGDLHHVEVIAELVLAAARLGHEERTVPVRRALADWAGRAAGWDVPVTWLELQVAVETEQADAVRAAASRLAGVGGDLPHDVALRAAADAWVDVVAGHVTADGAAVVAGAAEGLGARGLAWESSRLAGQAAIRVADAGAARGLLELARRLHRSPEGGEPTAASDAGLSERELEIARYVVDGLTHKEVGAQLYISPKTVEHHVARIRRKVQAGSRAEMLAILRDLVPPPEGDARR